MDEKSEELREARLKNARESIKKLYRHAEEVNGKSTQELVKEAFTRLHSPFLVVICGAHLARQPHPHRYPVAPAKPSSKAKPDELEAYVQRMEAYEVRLAAYYAISEKLLVFDIDELECDSGMLVPAKHLNFTNLLGEGRLVVALNSGQVRIIHTVHPTRKKP
jgi:hypothetical protein